RRLRGGAPGPPPPPPLRPTVLETPMIRRAFLVVCAVLALAVGAVACGGDSGSAANAQKVNLVLDWFPNADHAGIYGAVGEGYFADGGLDVTPTVPSDPA